MENDIFIAANVDTSIPKRETILVVDDVEVNREILNEILKKDYNIITASNGIEAVEKVVSGREDISLILLDIMMPEMDGYEVMETLTKSGYSTKIPVIIITAAGAEENEVKGLELGASDYITKPFYPKSVLRRVELQLELRRYKQNLERLASKKK